MGFVGTAAFVQIKTNWKRNKKDIKSPSVFKGVYYSVHYY